jgi:putative membrane protein
LKTFIEILKGAIIGIANVIPGVSGGTMAVVMNIYDKLIDAIDNIFIHPIKAIKSIWMYILGIILGICSSVMGISYLLSNYEIETTSLFVGLIIGALPIVIGQVNGKKVKSIDIILFFSMMMIVILLPFISLIGTSGAVNTNPILMLLIGIIAAITMVVPGVSGSIILMTIGYYDNITTMVDNAIKAIISLNITEFFSNFLVLLPFAVGVLVGIIFAAKLIKWLLAKYNKTVHWAILGLVASSPFAIIMNLDLSVLNARIILISVITFLIGCKIASLFSKIE